MEEDFTPGEKGAMALLRKVQKRGKRATTELLIKTADAVRRVAGGVITDDKAFLDQVREEEKKKGNQPK